MVDIFRRKGYPKMIETIPHQLPTDLALAHMLSIIEMNGEKTGDLVKNKLLGGKFFSLAPENTPQARLLDFDSGGVVAQQPRQPVGQYELAEVKSQAGRVADILLRVLATTRTSSLFIREPYKNKDETQGEFLKIGSDLFKKIASGNWDAFNLTEEVKYYSVPWSFLSIISVVKSSLPSFDELMKQANCVAVNAYDGESYVFWVEDNKPVCSG